MIIFQITLTGAHLQHLAMLKRQHETGVSAFDAMRWDTRYVTTTQALINQGLATHERPSNNPTAIADHGASAGGNRRFPNNGTTLNQARPDAAGRRCNPSCAPPDRPRVHLFQMRELG